MDYSLIVFAGATSSCLINKNIYTAVIFNFHHYIRIANAVDRTVLHIVVELDIYIIPLCHWIGCYNHIVFPGC